MNLDSHKKREALAEAQAVVVKVVVAKVEAAKAEAAKVAVVKDQVVAAKMAKKWTQPEEAMANPPRASMMLLKAAIKPSEQKAKAKTRRA